MRVVALALLSATACVVSGVAACPAETVRAVTYPPSFQYIEQERLQDTMWGLAHNVHALDVTLRADDLAPEQKKATSIALLDEMGRLAAKVSAPGQNTNHPMLDRHLDRFQLDIALARSALDRDPPDYGPAGRLTGACLYCHVGTGGGPLQP